MAYPSRPMSLETSILAEHSGAAETTDWASVEADLDLVRHTRANLLVIGPDRLMPDVIRAVVGPTPAIIVNPAEWERLALSHLWLWSGTLVFRNIDALDAEGQTVLSAWLERGSPERQIVSMAGKPLMPLVAAGAFDQRLYYRLNTVFISLGHAPCALAPVRG